MAMSNSKSSSGTIHNDQFCELLNSDVSDLEEYILGKIKESLERNHFQFTERIRQMFLKKLSSLLLDKISILSQGELNDHEISEI